MADFDFRPAARTANSCVRDELARLVAAHGVRRAARKSGLCRDSLLALLAGTPVRAGTLAIAERWYAQLSEASDESVD